MMERVFVVSLVVVLIAFLGGCSPDSEEPEPDGEETPAAIPAEDKPDAAEKSAEGNSDVVTLERPDLPGDVFFEEPLAIAANSKRLPGIVSEPKEMAETEETETAAEESSSSKKEPVDWAKLLPADQLHAEMLAIQDRFAPKLADVAAFNSTVLEFPPYFAEMGALAVIAGKHANDVPWRSDAKFVRELAAGVMSSQLRRGRKSFETVKGPFEKISQLLEGERPEELPEASEEGSFLFATDFGLLMKRLEIGQKSVRLDGGSEGAFSQNASDLKRQIQVMAALGAVIATEDFGYAEDSTYQGYARDFRQAALEAAQAAEAKDFAAFDTATNRMMQSCTQCHSDYRGL